MIASVMLVAMMAVTSSETLTLHMDYDASYSHMIEEGKYEQVNYYFDWLHERFWAEDAHTGKRDIQIRLFTFGGCNMTTEQIIEEMDKEGFRPATVKELLAFGAEFPDCHMDGETVALSRIRIFDDMVPSIGPDKWDYNPGHVYRSIGQFAWGEKWGESLRQNTASRAHFRFLAVAS